jgi:hypothetical protein
MRYDRMMMIMMMMMRMMLMMECRAFCAVRTGSRNWSSRRI